ncbi:phosphoethanolamine transferase [Salinisphaera japonica]|uniref:Membrane protein n=1 Tax=Salinisphaera japonica YTM-1 TaxID=1209778 RepID=A0A423PZ10_9GAMM|nr:phosphoethanolamine--lipid A transferase [Salinisphaera japonica]ROO30841.1 membrane protein [Salinisphaera japonica YTM-1]
MSLPDPPSSRGHAIPARPQLGVPLLTCLVALFIVGVDNRALWHELADVSHIGQMAGLGFTLAMGAFLTAAMALIFSVFAFRWVYKPFLVVVLLLASVIGYFMQTYGVVIDDNMIRNTLDTDTHEAQSLANAALVVHILLYGVLPSLLVVWVKIRRAVWWRQALIRIGFGLLLAVVAGGALASHYKSFSLTLREHRALRMYINPTYAIYAAVKLAKGEGKAIHHTLVPIAPNAHRVGAHSVHRRILVVVVGETTRAANWGLSGYARPTTPELAARRDIVNFAQATSCGTSTAVSVPCMFSDKPRQAFDTDRAGYTENLLDVLQRAGITVRWEENQPGGCKGVCARVPTTHVNVLNVAGICDNGQCRDEIFRDDLKQRIANTSGDTVIVLHTMGSHGPDYTDRYPPAFRVFTPVCDSNRPQDCSRQALINSYDNTVRYTDHMLAGLIDALSAPGIQADTGLIYLSDHGESLGENGIYLHGFPYLLAPEEQTRIPMIMWLSPGLRADTGIRAGCLVNRAQQPASQDDLFASVLGLMGVDAEDYDPRRDITAGCRGA